MFFFYIWIKWASVGVVDLPEKKMKLLLDSPVMILMSYHSIVLYNLKHFKNIFWHMNPNLTFHSVQGCLFFPFLLIPFILQTFSLVHLKLITNFDPFLRNPSISSLKLWFLHTQEKKKKKLSSHCIFLFIFWSKALIFSYKSA